MWLQDSLLQDLRNQTDAYNSFPLPRILIYGTDTHLANSQSFQTVPDLAGQLIRAIKSVRRVSSFKGYRSIETAKYSRAT
jgi:hypothetical protein